MQGDGADDDDGGHYFFFSAPASPVHYILRSPPSSTAAASSSPYFADAADAGCAGDFEFFAAHGGAGPGPSHKAGVAMSSAEELFVAGRIRVGCGLSSPIRPNAPPPAEGRRRHEDGSSWEVCGGDEDEEREPDGRSPRTTRRARSASPTRRSPRTAADRGGGAAFADPPSDSDPFASASSLSSSSSTSSSSSSAKGIRLRISLRDLLSRTGGDCAGAADQASSGTSVTSSRLVFWPPSSMWPSSSRSSKKLPACGPAPQPPQPGRRSASSDRGAAALAKRGFGGSASASGRRTTSLPYRQGLVLGCLGFGARSYGLAKSMHPLSSPLKKTKS